MLSKDKAYIVANEQQEREVLRELEQEGYVWVSTGKKPTEFVPSHIEHLVEFPYTLLDDGEFSWCYMSQLEYEEIVYDGRKEEQMSEKYIVSQEFMNKLEEWHSVDGFLLCATEISILPDVVQHWWFNGNNKENNNRLIAIIRWVNGEDVFEIEKPKKWVVRSDSKDSEGDYWYVRLDGNEHNKSNVGYDIETATRFDTKEEAESWTNRHQEVVEVDE